MRQTIEHPDDLARVESARKRSEVDDVGEEDAGVVEVVRDRVRLGLKALGDLLGKDVQQERLDAPLCGVPTSRARLTNNIATSDTATMLRTSRSG